MFMLVIEETVPGAGVHRKSRTGVDAGDKFCGCGSKVSSHQDYVAARRLPSRVGHSGMVEWFGVRLPTLSSLCELQTGGGGLREYSAAEDVTSESVPDSGIAGNGGQVEHIPGGGDVDLSLVVGGDQDAFVRFRARLCL